MSSPSDLDNSEACIRYLSHMLDLRVTELKETNHKMASLVRRTKIIHHDGKCSDTDSKGVVFLSPGERHFSKLVASKEAELLETDKKWQEALVCIADLEAQVQFEISSRKEKDNTIENLEDLLMLHESESSEIEALKCKNLELMNRLDSTEKVNSSLMLELKTLRECIQTKEESIAQTLIEKDDLEETSTCYKHLNSMLSQELTKLEAQLAKENEFQQRAEDDKKAWQLEKAQLMEQIEVLGGELALYQQGGMVSLGSQAYDVSNSQQSQTMATTFEMTALQAEKEDLEHQLEMCKSELAAMKNKYSCPSDQVQHIACSDEERLQIVSNLRKMLAKVSAENSRMSKALVDKSADLTRLEVELQKHKGLMVVQENQNMELVAQLLVLEDRIAESEVICRDSRESTERMAATAVKNADSSLQLQDQVTSLKSCVETKTNELHCCQTELDFLRCKYKTVSERYQQLLSHKNQMEMSNRQLVEKLSRRDEQSVETCHKCLDLEKVKLDSLQMKSSYEELKNKLDAILVSNRHSEINVSVSRTSHAVVREESAAKRCRTTSPLMSVRSICSPVHLQNHPVKGGFLGTVVDNRSSQLANVRSNRLPESSSSARDCFNARNEIVQDLVFDDDEFADDFESIEAERLPLTSNDSNKAFVKLTKRHLISETSIDTAAWSNSPIHRVNPSVSEHCAAQSSNQGAILSNTLPMPMQNVKRIAGRASLSLAHRSPKSTAPV